MRTDAAALGPPIGTTAPISASPSANLRPSGPYYLA
jgi:hypothetical protein